MSKNLLPVTAGFICFLLTSCNNKPESVPFPEKELGYTAPITVPLEFSETRKLNWDTVKKGSIRPVVKKLDIDALPSKPYDTAGFRPFIESPKTIKVDFDKLPDASFSLDALPSKPLQFKISVLPAPSIIKAAAPIPKSGIESSILDFGQLQGFRGNITTCLLQDRNGSIWIASDAGLYCYDGENIKKYLDGNPQDIIAGMAEDNNGRIWTIRDAGLSVIDIVNGTISYSNAVSSTPNNLSKITKDDKGHLFISNIKDNGAAVIDPAILTFKHITKNNGLSGNLVFDVVQDKDKNLWLSADSSIDIITTSTGKIRHLTRANGLSLNESGSLTVDQYGRIWMTSSNGAIEMADTKQGILQHYGKAAGTNNNLFVFQILPDNKNNIWICTTKGIKLIDPVHQKIKYINKKHGIESNVIIAGLQDRRDRFWIATVSGINIIENEGEIIHPVSKKSVSASYQDPDGKLWLGGFGTGVEIVDRQKRIIKAFDKSHGLSNDSIQAFTKVGNSLWITSNGGLDIIDFANKNISHIGQKEGLTNNIVYSVFRTAEGDVWFVGPKGGIDFMDSQKTILRHAGIKEGLSDSNIVDIKQDNGGLLWVATVNNGIDIIDPVNGTVKNLINIPPLKGASNKLLMADTIGRVWIGTDKGLVIADTRKNSVTIFTTTHGLSHNHITSLSPYKGNVIAGTTNKVNIITPPEQVNTDNGNKVTGDQWKVHILSKSERLIKESNSWATDLITKEGEFLWCDNGVTIINNIEGNSDSAATYVAAISVMNQPRYFINKSSLKETDSLWSKDSSIIKDKISPIEKAAYKQGLKWDSISGPYNMPVNLRIPYDQNYLQFQYAQANLGRPDTTWYSYILEGIDKQWSAATNKTVTENYLNLSPGIYTFKVTSKGPNGRWNKPAELSFTITPPWWQTWWAYTLYALVAAGLLRAYIVFRSRRLQKENKLLEEKVALRTSQLQQSLEDLKATQAQLIQSEKMASLGELTAGIAHEIQNPLNFVNNFSEVNTELAAELKDELNKLQIPADQKNNLEEIADDIIQNQEKINFHGKRADGIVKGMLQHSRGNSGQKEPVDINALADEYLRLSYHGLRAKDKSFNATMKTDFDSNLPPVHIVQQDVGRVILNLFTNAFYSVTQKKNISQNGYEPIVSVYTKQLKNKVEIKVKDNGMGIPQKVLDKIFQPFFTTKPAGQGTGLGLSLSYDIITKMHGGEIKVETKEGEGAEFTILLPL